MVHVGASPDAYFSLVCQKAWVDPKKLTPADYVLYGLTTTELTDMV
jgi:hypothetical protein